MFGLLKILIGGSSAAIKMLFIVGLGTVLLIKPPFIHNDNHTAFTHGKYAYQINYDGRLVDDVMIFDRNGNFIEDLEYTELTGVHKKVVDAVLKEIKEP